MSAKQDKRLRKFATEIDFSPKDMKKLWTIYKDTDGGNFAEFEMFILDKVECLKKEKRRGSA
jgi:hypothetical protein